MSAQVEGESGSEAAAPRDDELPEELRGNFRNALQPLSKLSRCDIIGDRKGYALTRFGEIIAEQALSKWSSEPTNGAHGDTFREGRRGAYYLLSIVKTSSSKVATAVEMFLDHAGPARTYLCNLFAGAVSDAPWAQGGKVAVCSLVPYGKECSEDGDAYCAVHKSKCRDAPDGCIAHRHFALCEAVVENVHNAVHLEGLLSYDLSLKRPGFRAEESEVTGFYDTYLPDVDVDALQDLDDRTTLLVTAPYFLEHNEIDAALRALQKVIDKKNLYINVVFAALAQGESQTGKALLKCNLDADLKQEVIDDIGKAVAQERKNSGSAATEYGQFWVFIYAIFAGMYLYVGSAGTRTTSSKTKGRELVRACTNLNAKRFLTAARALLKPRMNGHQGNLTEGSKNERWAGLFAKLKQMYGEDVHVGDVVVPLWAGLCNKGDTKDLLVRDVGLVIEDEGIALVAKLDKCVQRCPRCPFTGPRVYKPL